MNRQIIMQGGKPAFVVIPIDEWRRIESTLEGRIDAAAVASFWENPEETFPDSVVEALLAGGSPSRTFREYRGLTQEELARAAGTSPIYISQIERTGAVGPKTLAKIAKALNVDPGLLKRG